MWNHGLFFLCHSSTGHPLLMSWYLRAESPRPLVSLGVPTVLPGLDEVLYREAEERKQRQELREQEALHLGFPSRWGFPSAEILIPKKPEAFNSKFCPLKSDHPKSNRKVRIVFQASFFKGHVKLWEGKGMFWYHCQLYLSGVLTIKYKDRCSSKRYVGVQFHCCRCCRNHTTELMDCVVGGGSCMFL